MVQVTLCHFCMEQCKTATLAFIFLYFFVVQYRILSVFSTVLHTVYVQYVQYRFCTIFQEKSMFQTKSDQD